MTSLFRKVSIFLTLLCFCTAPFAYAGEKEWYTSVWMVEPDQVLKSDAQWYAPGQTMASARLIPAKLFSTNADILLDNSILIPAGSKFTAVASKTKTACALQKTLRKGLDSVINFDSSLIVCLVDTNGDSKFDAFFTTSTLKIFTMGFVTGSGKIPSHLSAMDPVSLTVEDPRSLNDSPRVYLKYGWFASLAGELIFQVCLKEAESGYGKCLVPTSDVKRAKLPTHFQLLGSEFLVDAKDENRVRVSQLTPVKQQPLFIE